MARPPPAWPTDLAHPPGDSADLAPRPRNPGSSNTASRSRHGPRHGSRASNFDPGALGSLDLDLDLDLTQLAVDSSDSDSEFTSSRPTQRAGSSSHARSMSNPFPSLFSAKKKKKGKEPSASGFGDSDSSGVDGPVTASRNGGGLHTATAATSGHAPQTHSRPGRKSSFSTGPCITCGSMVRWAQGVSVFRCSICLTVNDLPLKGRPTESGSGSQPKTAQAEDGTSETGPISVERTRSIIKRCLRKYLEAVLSDVDVGPPQSSPHKSRQLTPSTLPSTSPAPDYISYAPNKPIDRPVDQPSSNAGPSDANVGRARRPSTHIPYTQATDGVNRQPPNTNRPLRHHHGNVSRSAAGPAKPGAVASQAIPIPSQASRTPAGSPPSQDVPEPKKIFKDLEDYIVAHFLAPDCLDSSFVPQKHAPASATVRHPVEATDGQHVSGGAKSSRSYIKGASSSGYASASAPPPEEVDPKMLLAGDIAENSSWWSGSQRRGQPKYAGSASQHHRRTSESGRNSSSNSRAANASRPIHIDWPVVDDWFNTVLNAGGLWTAVYESLVASGLCKAQPSFMLEQIEAGILKAQEHAQRLLLKATETVLKRPVRRIGELGDYRFLVIALANPLLQASFRPFSGRYQVVQPTAAAASSRPRGKSEAAASRRPAPRTGPASGQHSVIIKRILGLMSNSPDDWQSQLTACFSQFSDGRFMQTKDLVGGFLAYRLVRHNEKKEETKAEVTDGLVPKVSAEASVSSLHAALNQSSSRSAANSKKTKAADQKKVITHGDDWQIKAAVRVLGILFNANNYASERKVLLSDGTYSRTTTAEGSSARARGRGQILPTSDFYMALLDNLDLVADFEAWENKRSKFSFCQYPFLLSIWAKIQILEYEARRQMMNKARDAFFDSIMTHRNVDHHFILSVRRDCLVEDSLKGVSEAVGSGGDDVKKGLRIIFSGEEGVDAGGLRKEWFLLLVREVFNPDHGMFIYDDESQYCYFNPSSFETSDQYFLVGVVLGLAIYNSTILDIALPPFAFRKLLLAAPPATAGLPASHPRPAMAYTLSDLAEYRPRLARGLQQLLDYDGDVESTFELDFTITVDRYGSTETVSLCPNGDRRTVTNSNRREYVDLYVRYLLDTSISRQFEPFKRGFFTVCGCNALGLFRSEEIELLVRGSDEKLDISSLRLAATYDNWGFNGPNRSPETEPTIQWFWQTFEEASAKDQRKLLIFITGSDRIPATGPASLSIRFICLGDDTGRFPTARTCFNTLTMYRYASKENLQKKLWEAVNESEGFGLK